MNSSTFALSTDYPFSTVQPDAASGLELHYNAPEDLLLNSALNSMLSDICERGSHVMEPISNHICSMQEMFLDMLYYLLEDAGVNLSEKMTIFLNEDGKLALMDEHPDRSMIEAVLAENPQLARLFAILAAHSEIARDIENIYQLFNSLSSRSYMMHENAGGYHLSLKGGMSHFYFV
ncbi:MAG: hypothetical protein IJD04_01425 [Desulfovibrionaceae bacterium]|nr:hypothetical protein [Desulfovibrionaceae bacterium]